MKIEEGKYYRTRDGRKVGPVAWVANSGHSDQGYWRADGFGNWFKSGSWNGFDGSPLDLVSEWPDETTTPDDYYTLRAILDDAYAQAASGKGKERHANDRPFLSQPICEIGRMLGSVCDGELYQAIKKAQEASNMLARGENKRAEAELLGAINYLAAAVILIRESEHGK